MLTLEDNSCPKSLAKDVETNIEKNTDKSVKTVDIAFDEVALDSAETKQATPLYDPETQRALSLFVVLMRCSSSVGEQARKDIARYKLSVSEFAVLELLYHKGPTPLGAIAEQVLLTSGSMTYVIDQLEKQGLVRRVACPADRRRLYGELTEAGRSKIAAIFPGHAEQLRQVMTVLTPDEQDEMFRLLKKLGLSQQASRTEPK